MALSLVFDHAQPRLAHDRIAAVAAGLELNGQYFENTYIDPVTNTLMLRPAPLDPLFHTLNTGAYRKLDPSEFAAVNPSAWREAADYKLGNVDAGPWIASKGAAPGALISNDTWEQNRGLYISIFSYSAGDDYELLKGGWNPTPDIGTSVGFRLWSGGTFELWKNGLMVAEKSFSGAKTPGQQTNVNIDILLIPCRRRELLVLSRNGNGFVHVFDDIEETDNDPIITPASKIWVSIPLANAQLQVAPISYPVSGYATSLDYELAEAPTGTDTYETFDNPAFAGGDSQVYAIYGDPPYGPFTADATTTAVLVEKDNPAAAFVPNSVNKACRLRVNIFGDDTGSGYSKYTPFVYGAQRAFRAIAEDTDDSEAAEVLESLCMLSLDVPDHPSGVSVRGQLLDPQGLSPSIANLLDGSNRPVKLAIDSVNVVDGQTDPVEDELLPNSEAEKADVEIRDRWKSLENYQFRERVPLDGFNLAEAFKFILRLIGLEESDWDIEDVDFRLPSIPSAEAGDFNVVIEIGDKASEWIERLVENYAATYHYGFEPTASGIKFVFKSPATLDAADPAYYLYTHRNDAIADGILEEDVWKHLARKVRKKRLEPEANDIRVTGWDPRAKRPIQTHYPDTESQDPALAPSARPENWLGEPRRYGLFEPAITTQDVCDRAAELLHDRLTPVQKLYEVTCELMIDADGVVLWRGRDIWLHGYGRCRILSFSVDFEKEPGEDDDWQWREATYVLRKV